ncbi:MAG: NAD-dependent malic enzyme [Candidatus Omnitrophica bacterium]|jgi:malate dehydrogenase (oxaloacetate-decarboxylating)|nr:NAD-dependent malic enzyme [Candidatus Omnitrophota bacterium]
MPEEKYSHKIVKKIRFRIPDVPGALGTLALTLGMEGVTLGDITKIHLTSNYVVREIIAFFDDEKHFLEAIAAVKKLKGYRILNIQDEVLNLHKGGKIEVRPRVKVDTLNDLRMIYTPGVAQVCNYIVSNPAAARKYTSIGNTVCIATNGSAVLGLGDIGVLAAMPVMEGKSIILYKMANVSCVPLLLKSDNADEIVNALTCIAETFGIIMIEDVKAPLCFEIEQRLQKKVKVPVFHDDQHGTATVILGALIKALKITKKRKEKVSVVINGAGAAGIAAAKLLLGYGFKDIVLCDRAGAIYEGRTGDMNDYKKEIACITNKRREKGSLKDVFPGKDVFIGLSAPGLVTKDMVKTMNKSPILFAMANPIPEIWPKDAQEAGAAIALDGRTVNNALVFPGIIRGALDAQAREITTDMKFSAAETIASLSGKNEVVPNFMNVDVHKSVARAVFFATGSSRH